MISDFDTGSTSALDFVAALRAVRERAGSPKFDAMAAKVPSSRATLHGAVRPNRTSLPTWNASSDFLRACGIEETELPEWEAWWRRCGEPNGDADAGGAEGVPSVVRPRLVRLSYAILACVVSAALAGGSVYWLLRLDRPATGDDPISKGCERDAQRVAVAEVKGAYRLDLLWSSTCGANWGRIVRLDDKAFGNRIGVVVYGSFDDPPARQSRERPDIGDLYTPIMVVDPNQTVCVTGTIWTGAAALNAQQPLCR